MKIINIHEERNYAKHDIGDSVRLTDAEEYKYYQECMERREKSINRVYSIPERKVFMNHIKTSEKATSWMSKWVKESEITEEMEMMEEEYVALYL